MDEETEYEGVRFVRTSYACPEQYDVFDGDEQVGYVRLRRGTFSVSIPDANGRDIFTDRPADSDGVFETWVQRDEYLTRAAKLINQQNQ